MTGLRSSQSQAKKKDSILSSSPARQNHLQTTKQLPSPPHRRSTSRSKQALLLSPALSSNSLSASASPDSDPFSPPTRTINFLNPLPSPVSVSRDLMDMPSYSGSGDISPTLSATVKGKGRERQTRLQEHLKVGKQGSSTSSSKPKPTVLPAKRGRKPKVVVREDEEEELPSTSSGIESKQAANTVSSLSEEEADVRLGQRKYESIKRIADYGLSPNPEGLGNALLSMDPHASSPGGVTVQSFQQAVSAQSRTPRQLDSRKPRQSVTFDLHESPASTTHASHLSTIPEPRTPSRSSARGTRSSNSNSAYPTSILSTPTTTLAPSPDILLATPSDRKSGRLSAFNTRRNSSTMVAAELQGMGRVAMSKEVLFERLGTDTAEKAMTAASDLPSPSLLFGQALPQLGSPIIDAFSSARRKSGRITKEEEPEDSTDNSGDDKRIGLVKAWLDSPEMVEEESREGWSSVPQEWSDDVFTSKGPFVEDPVEVEEVEVVRRGGGKSVRGLVKTKRRRYENPEISIVVDALEEVEIEDDDVSLLIVDEEVSVSRLSSSKKGKGRPINSEGVCICDSNEDGEAMVRCDDCAVWYHLECLDIASAKDLGKEWFCFKCSGSAVPVGPSPSKRAKMIPPTTPVLKSEPTFVPSAFSPKPKGNFYRNSAADMVLAPSPQSSPIRRPVPFIAPPTTPQAITFELNSRADYSPRSPLHHHRNGRPRIISGSFEEQGQLWDHTNHLADDESHHSLSIHLHPSLDEEARIWHDVNMTPSRSLSSSAFGWTESSTIGTPLIGSRRSATLALGTSASQDFLSGLHGQHVAISSHPLSLLEQQHHDSQRVFSQPLLVVPSSPSNMSGGSSHHALSSSPLGPKGGRPLVVVGGGHQRKPSLPSNFFHPSSSSAATTKVVAQGVFSSPDRRSTSGTRSSQVQDSLA